MKTILITLLCFGTISTQSFAQNIKPYKEVITSESLTKKGFLQVHLLNDKLYFEIPSAMLNKDMLFVKHDRRSEYKQIKWTKSNDKIHLIIPEIKSETGIIIPVVKGSTIKKITPATFPILAMGPNHSSYVIDVTALFLSPPKELPGSGTAIFDGLASINKVVAVDNTLEVKTTKTITSNAGPVTVDADFSLFLLPEPMMPRLYDPRMGFMMEGDPVVHGSKPIRGSITRWRLEKKHKDQALSDPITPITLYFDPATPDKFKPYIKAGVEEWLPAFEAAGFTNAIVVKEPPIDDANWSMNSMRYSYIHWTDETNYRGKESDAEIGAGYQIIDARTGEILNGSILMGAIASTHFKDYFIRCAPLDARAQEFPFPDDLMGEILQYVVAHEAGHVFGLLDGDYGKFMYPFEKMRDKTWLQNMGHTPSAMNYARQNFIVQPEDDIPPALLQPKVGPTDHYSIRWGYTPFNDADTPDAELPHLEKIVKEQATTPWYMFLGGGNASLHEPQTTIEVVESNNPIKATALGIKNLKRVIELIPHATRHEPGDVLKKSLYDRTLDLWIDQMKLVVSQVGGSTKQYRSGQEGLVRIHVPIPASRQKETVAFLIKEAFHPPLWMDAPNLFSTFEKDLDESNFLSNPVTIISRRQIMVLWFLLNRQRLENLQILSQTTKDGYSLTDLLEDLDEGLWSELKTKHVKINPYRMEIQLAYIAQLKERIEIETPSKLIHGYSQHSLYNKYTSLNDIRGILFSTLDNLEKSIEEALVNTRDIATKGHLELCLLEINSVKN